MTTQYALDADQALDLRDRLNAWLEAPRTAQDRYDLQLTLRGIFAQENAPTVSADTWIYSPAIAARYTQTHEQQLNSMRKPKEPPHHLRCEFVKNGVRCRRGEGHERLPNDPGHEEPKL